tara:strand:+ start:474 stop:896 length:423 start_codon:yes stop_codon:yes gene_type:complete
MAIDITNQSKQVATSKNAYSDLDLHFKKHPQTGDVVVRTDVEAVKRSIRNIVLTNNYERPFKPGFGGSIRNLLFELTSDRKMRKVRNRLIEIITTFEPRVENVDVRLSDRGGNEVNLTVYYTVVNATRKESMEMTITRAR